MNISPELIRAAQLSILGGDLCRPCLRVLPVTGAAVAAVSDPLNSFTFCATDPIAARIDELQFDLGEGPCWDAVTAARPVLLPNLRSLTEEWPAFTGAVQAITVAALFVFPLLIGPTRVGALSLYRSTPGPLPSSAVTTVKELTGTVAQGLATGLMIPSPQPIDPADPADRRQIQIATGVVMAQLGLTAIDAYGRLQAHAFTAGLPMSEIAGRVNAHHLQLPA